MRIESKMYLMQHTAFLVLLFHQCIVNGFNIFDMGFRLNYLNSDSNSITTSDLSDIEMKWILQELDHFNSSDKRMWQMTYLERLRYWRENGPIYILLNYVQSDNYLLGRGIMKELAEETHGALYLTEHRYYGDSKPFKNLDAKNIKYLTSRQTLADVAKLINYLKSLSMYKDSKVVVIGGFYNGNLAAWMKVLYPELVDAAISSSAPVLAQKDFSEYLEKLKDNIEHYGGTECLNEVAKTFANYDMLLQSPEGVKQLKKDENICDTCDMTNKENQQVFFFYKTLLVSNIGHNPLLIKSFCDQVSDKNDYSSFLNKYSKVNNSDLNCIYYNFQDEIKDIKDNRNLDYVYKFVYQSCTEFGHFPTTTSKKQPFLNIPLEFYIKVCTELFGNDFNEKRVDEGIEISNKLYGGLKPNVTKVVFTNGDMDPCSTISVLKDLSDDVKALVIPGGSYSDDFHIESKESEEARKVEKYLIKKWIGAYE